MGGRLRAFFAGFVAAFVVVGIGCVSVTRPLGDNDAFTWWAEIFIPTAVGAATVLVSYAAFVASRRATELAHELERQRETNEAQRSSDERRRRLQDMAIGEARALTSWLHIAMGNPHWQSDDIEKVGEARHGRTLELSARVNLQQSVVPGAQDLLELSVIDVEHAFQFKPDEMYMPDRLIDSMRVYASSEMLRVDVKEFRRERSIARARRWALDPEEASTQIAADLEWARRDIGAYMDYRLGLKAAGLRPLSEIPDPPWKHDERVAFFEANGMIEGEPGAS